MAERIVDEIAAFRRRVENWRLNGNDARISFKLGEARAILAECESLKTEALEQARLNGMGAERELALMGKLETANRHRDALKAKLAEVERERNSALLTLRGAESVLAGNEVQRDALKAKLERAVEALRRADRFISNGIELGFIRMPDADCPDPAHETPRIIRAALAEIEAPLTKATADG